MKLEQLTVHLRQRTAWEAIELGMALVRRDAGAVFKPWLLITLPILLLLNALGWALDLIGLAGFLMWWLKPVFDRIPLFVISRAVFGATPTVRETLAAQLRWGWRPMLHYLTWRRLSPARSVFLPVDLLEGVDGARLRDRRRVLGGSVYGHAALLTLLCVNFEIALCLGGIFAVMLYFPLELLPDTLRDAWTLLALQSPQWSRVALNLLVWSAVTVIEPFFVGAGFGLYLNRRTELEAWDVELVFRKLRQRLAAGASGVLLVLVGVLGMHSDVARAQDAAPASEESVESPTDDRLEQVFADQFDDDRRFRKAADQAHRDPDLNRTRTQKRWEPKTREEKEQAPREQPTLPWLQALAGTFAFIGEWGLWILLAVLVLALLISAPRWLPWMRGAYAPRVRIDNAITTQPVDLPQTLPADVASAARRLWKSGQRRDALALLYRAGVVALARQLQTTLPPGATEAECLRASRRLPQAEDRQLFAQVVRIWQYAAYAQRDPDEDEFEALLQQLQQRGGWLA
ncbi:DUF4129 domain-containing protein [Pseudoxanthomonas indica]|uniref:Protein-glutamine gamma-glutamyltransferase-like C-terminal domain-containing protein n=1 Tax=Pseudoxanthomonas indica TaxID=428993 RepID=A0A1T5KIT4_9GAMM|nr:DUF4129 domain-containing protein [Pseudoxanthomonas indica]GGD49532.1 hypothetical protein GCM10007235_21840 [Pseudoxanthomonas indica]SKC63369.1 protein of unknown function [Pseudoxanthomonas indica]